MTHAAVSGSNGAPTGNTGTPHVAPSMCDSPSGSRRGSGAAVPSSTGGAAVARPSWPGASHRPLDTLTTSSPSSGSAAAFGVAILVSETAHILNAGWKENGSTASYVTALTLRYSPYRSFQWNGAKQPPGQHPVGHHGGQHGAAATRGHLDEVAVGDARARAASSGWISTNGPGSSLVSLATLPVLVIVCHWCCSRPVLSMNGKSSSGSSAAGTCGARMERRATVRRGERQPRHMTVVAVTIGWLHPVVEVADRVASPGRRARSATAPVGAQALVGHAAQVVAGLRVPEAADLLEDLLRRR